MTNTPYDYHEIENLYENIANETLETEDDDNFEQEDNLNTRTGGSNKLSAIFLIINAALGAGLLNFPQAFDEAGGIVTAVSVQAVLLVCISLGLLILVHSSFQVKAVTLQDTLQGVCGSATSVVCSLLIALYCFGTCVTFLIIIGDQFDRVLMSLVGPDFCHTWYMNRRCTITISAISLILPLCFSKRIDFLKYVSSLGVAAVLYVVGLVIYQYYTGNFIPGPIKTQPNHWTDLFYVVPVICFGYQCHVSAIPIYSCMWDRSIISFSVVVTVALAVCTAAYTLTGSYGYLTFGSNVSSDVLQSYGGAEVSVLLGILAIAIKTITTYPILLYCGREAVNNVWCGLLKDGDLATGEQKRRIIIASIWFTLTVLLAVVSPDIGVVIDALGSLAAVFIFIFPGICCLQINLHRDPTLITSRTRWSVLGAIIFMSTGAFIFGVVLVQTGERLIKETEAPVKLCV
uniref:Amino acid transporter transmembrane domain-containing protein n=1 Tax=Clastoptera arizonana TaxID=38151 RepID=A0A1B6CJT7_9HEMI